MPRPHRHYHLLSDPTDTPRDPVAAPPRRSPRSRRLRRPSAPLTYLALGCAALAGAYASMSTTPPTRVLGSSPALNDKPTVALVAESRQPLSPLQANTPSQTHRPATPSTTPSAPHTAAVKPAAAAAPAAAITMPEPPRQAVRIQRGDDHTSNPSIAHKSPPTKPTTTTTSAGHKPLAPIVSVPTTNTGPWGLPLATTDRHVMFLIDASGSVVDAFPFILQELAETLERLEPHQTFTVRFYRNGGVLQMPPGPLTPATAQATARAARWLTEQPPRLVPYGRTTPLPALRTALNDPTQPEHTPDHIILIADQPAALARSFPETQRFLKQLTHDPAQNKPTTRISTVHLLQFMPSRNRPSQPPAPGAAQTPLFRTIAHQFHGTYLAVPISTLSPANESRPIQIPLR
ncbi:MAG: hypothetical protein AAGI68_03360 [Planctomycetota bacterium]